MNNNKGGEKRITQLERLNWSSEIDEYCIDIINNFGSSPLCGIEGGYTKTFIDKTNNDIVLIYE